MIRTEIKGDRFIDLTDEIVEETRAPAMDLARRSGDLLLAEVKGRLRLVTGRTSAPGEAPAYQEGELLRSFTRLPGRVKGNTVTSGVRSSDPYGKVNGLEYGHVTKAGTQVKARPFLRPSEDAIESAVSQLAEELL